jgi:ribulose-bisphosphate carboxylase large chain
VTRFTVTYRVHSDPAAIEARARAIAVEQSVEMPLDAVTDRHIHTDIVGHVDSITDRGGNLFDVRIALATATVGTDAAQLLNMAFGNTSLHPDVTLVGLDPPPGFTGPRHGIAGLRARANARNRALTCAAIKPQGLPPERLADLVERFARGGIDFVKDDHGLADQAYSCFTARVPLCAAAARRAAAATGRLTHYVPSLSGSLDALRTQAHIALNEGLDTVLIAPMLAGFANIQALAREFPDLAIIAHPTMGGAARIAPELLIGALFPLVGAHAVIFPNHGGRFGYSETTCRSIASAARVRNALPVPAGGMTLTRVPELLAFYGPDVMLLIGGNLLQARDRLTETTREFITRVAAAA